MKDFIEQPIYEVIDNNIDEIENKVSRKSFPLQAVLVTLVTGAVCALTLLLTGGDNPPISKSSIIIFILVVLLSPIELYIKQKREKTAPYHNGLTNKFRFSPDFYVNEDELSVTLIYYSQLIKATETKDAFLLNLEKELVHIVPKNCFTLGSSEELSFFLADKLGVRFKKK